VQKDNLENFVSGAQTSGVASLKLGEGANSSTLGEPIVFLYGTQLLKAQNNQIC